MTAMTSAAGASMVIDWVDWSAMGSRLAAAGRSPCRHLDTLLLTSSHFRLDSTQRPHRGPRATMPSDGRGKRGPGVREFSVPATTKVGPDEALTDLLAKNVAEVGDQTGFRVRRGGAWQDVTWKEFGDQVTGVAKGLIASGVEAGDRVALQAKTRYEWAVIDFAIWTAGAVTVPIYETSSADQVAWILADSGATAVIVEKDEHAEAVVAIRAPAPLLGPVIVIGGHAVGPVSLVVKGVSGRYLRRRGAGPPDPPLPVGVAARLGARRPRGC